MPGGRYRMRNILMTCFNVMFVGSELCAMCMYIVYLMLFSCFAWFYIIIEIPTHRINYLFINIQDVKLIEVLATFHNPACVEIIILWPQEAPGKCRPYCSQCLRFSPPSTHPPPPLSLQLQTLRIIYYLAQKSGQLPSNALHSTWDCDNKITGLI